LANVSSLLLYKKASNIDFSEKTPPITRAYNKPTPKAAPINPKFFRLIFLSTYICNVRRGNRKTLAPVIPAQKISKIGQLIVGAQA